MTDLIRQRASSGAVPSRPRLNPRATRTKPLRGSRRQPVGLRIRSSEVSLRAKKQPPGELAGFIRRCFIARRLHRRAGVADVTMTDLIRQHASSGAVPSRPRLNPRATRTKPLRGSRRQPVGLRIRSSEVSLRAENSAPSVRVCTPPPLAGEGQGWGPVGRITAPAGLPGTLLEVCQQVHFIAGRVSKTLKVWETLQGLARALAPRVVVRGPAAGAGG